VLAAVALGVAGSVHCAAMCGLLVMVVGARRTGAGEAGQSRTRAWIASTARYHGGRVLVYVLLGALAGAGGAAVADAGFGRALAVLAGVTLLAQALAATAWVSGARVFQWLAAQVSRLVGGVAGWLRRHGLQGAFTLGAINGLLPCGLVYAALTAAAGLGDLSRAVAFMAAFGAGTVPVLAVMAWASGAATSRLPVRVRRAAPAVLALVGLLLIVRGIGMPHGEAHAAHAAAPPVTPHAH